MSDEETLILLDRLQLAPEHHYTLVCSERVAHMYSSNIKNKLMVKTKQGIQRPEISILGQTQKMRRGSGTLAWSQLSPLKSGYSGEKSIYTITHLKSVQNGLSSFLQRRYVCYVII